METCGLVALDLGKQTVTKEDEAFLHEFEQRVVSTIEKHELFTQEDLVLVAVSGGKDSTVLLYLLQKFGYRVEAVTVDVHIGCYTQENLARIKEFCQEVGVKLHVTSFREEYGSSVCFIRDAIQEHAQKLTSCTVCGVLRRNVLNRIVRESGAKIIATGHNMDDEAGSIWMNFLRNKMELCSWLGPKTESTSDLFARRVKPLYFIPEKDIVRYSKLKRFRVNYTPCPCGLEAFRSSTKQFFGTIEAEYPHAKENIVKYFLEKKLSLQALFTKRRSSVVRACLSCGEPAKDAYCRTCKLLNQARQASLPLS